MERLRNHIAPGSRIIVRASRMLSGIITCLQVGSAAGAGLAALFMLFSAT